MVRAYPLYQPSNAHFGRLRAGTGARPLPRMKQPWGRGDLRGKKTRPNPYSPQELLEKSINKNSYKSSFFSDFTD
jgi:hypothetical protein